MADSHKNFAYSLVTTAPVTPTTGTSLTVTTGDGTKFPTIPFNATVWPANQQPTTTNAEIVRVTARSTDTLTITRAQEATTARSIQVGDQISATITAKTLTDVENSIYTPATFTVAPSSSGYKADYYTDGSADDVEINAALAALSTTSGGKVLLKPGTYNLSAVITIGVANSTLEGEGFSTIILKYVDYNGNIINPTANYVTVKNLKIDGNRANVTHDNHGIVPVGVTGVKLLNLYITDVVHHSIQPRTCTDLVIDGCYIQNTGKVSSPTADGVAIIVGGLNYASCDNTKITNCTIYNTGFHGIQNYYGSTRTFISNCKITSVGQTETGGNGNGIQIHPGSQDVHISNCYVASGGAQGYGLACETDDSTTNGTGIKGLLVENSTFELFANAGIAINGAVGVSIKGCNIRNNGQTASSGNDYGIKIIQGFSTLCPTTDVLVQGNNIYDNQATPTQARPLGVYSATTDRLKIETNNFYNHATDNTVFVDSTATANSIQIKNNMGLNPNKSINLGSLAGSITIDRKDGDIQYFRLVGNGTLNVQTGKVIGDTLTLIIEQDPTGSRTATWSSTWAFTATASPTLSTTALKKDVFSFVWDGTKWRESSRAQSQGSILLDGDGNRSLTVNSASGSTAGGSLTIQSGRPLSGQVDKSAGDLVLSTGVTTGTGTSKILFKTASSAASTASTDNAVATVGTWDGSGRLGVGVTPTAVLHLKAGTATANTAPLKLASGVNLTTPEDGAVEYDGTHLYTTIGSTRYQLDQQSGTGAPVDASYVALATNGTLTNERVLTGTSNQITITDNGAGSTVVLSTPQNIHTSATPTFAGMSLGTSNLSTVGNISLDGSAVRDITVARSASGAGNNLTIQPGGALSGATNTAAGTLYLSSGISTGSVRSTIRFKVAPQGGSGTGDNTPVDALELLSGASNGNAVLALGTPTGTTTGLSTTANAFALRGTVAGAFEMYRHSTSNTAGNNVTVQSGGATSGATDKASGDLILTSGISTGTGASKVRIQTNTVALSTGTSDNTATDRVIVTSPKSLTNNTTTTVASMTLASGSVVAGRLTYTVEVTDGTDFQYETGTIAYGVTNKAASIANNTTTKFGNQQAATAGTLAVTFTITAASPALIQINANSSLTPSTGYPRVTMVIENLTQQAVAIS